MTGNTFAGFMDDLLSMGGPEKEFLFRGKKYFLQSQLSEKDTALIELEVFECFGECNNIFLYYGKDYAECVEQFEQAPIFDGLTIYEAEKEIEVLYG